MYALVIANCSFVGKIWNKKLTKKTWAVECNSDILNKIDKSEARKYAELCYHQYDQ